MKENKKPLTNEELEQLEKQYNSLTYTLFQYDTGIKSKDFKTWPVAQQEQTKAQYEFMKFALNETLEVLMMHHHLKDELAKDAASNKFVKLNTKFNIMKYQRIQKRKNQIGC